MQAFILQPKTDRAHLREGERGLLRLPDGPKPSGPALCFKHTSDESFGEVLIGQSPFITMGTGSKFEETAHIP